MIEIKGIAQLKKHTPCYFQTYQLLCFCLSDALPSILQLEGHQCMFTGLYQHPGVTTDVAKVISLIRYIAVHWQNILHLGLTMTLCNILTYSCKRHKEEKDFIKLDKLSKLTCYSECSFFNIN